MDFPSGTVINNLSFNTRYLGLIPDQGNNILHAAGQLNPRGHGYKNQQAAMRPQSSQKKKKKKVESQEPRLTQRFDLSH